MLRQELQDGVRGIIKALEESGVKIVIDNLLERGGAESPKERILAACSSVVIHK